MRVGLAQRRRRELDWHGPHLHFCAEHTNAAPGAQGDAPRRSRAHLRRWVDSLARGPTPSHRHALLHAAWAGRAGDDFRPTTDRASDRTHALRERAPRSPSGRPSLPLPPSSKERVKERRKAVVLQPTLPPPGAMGIDSSEN